MKFNEMYIKMLNEVDEDNIENVVFLQDEKAVEVLKILDEEGEDAAMSYLQQWHNPGEHMRQAEWGNGTSDRIYEKDGYRMFWNSDLGYIGLEYDISKLNR